MGSKGSKQSLVIMTNGDVYYVWSITAESLIATIKDGSDRVYSIKDTKSGATIALNTRHISSVVDQGGFKHLDGTGGDNAN
jgi:hypothetical protein